MTVPTMPGGDLFTTTAVDALRFAHERNMPDRVFVFTHEHARYAGAVLLDRWVFSRVEPCRLSRPRSAEQDTGGAKREARTWVLIRPVSAPTLHGTERVLVLGRAGAIHARVVAAYPASTFQTMQRADVAADGVGPLTVGTTRARGPLRLAWSTSITATNP